jgi:hypothetical protein
MLLYALCTTEVLAVSGCCCVSDTVSIHPTPHCCCCYCCCDLLCCAALQSSSGAASTLERLTKETDANIGQVHADVAAKKNLVSTGVYV